MKLALQCCVCIFLALVLTNRSPGDDPQPSPPKQETISNNVDVHCLVTVTGRLVESNGYRFLEAIIEKIEETTGSCSSSPKLGYRKLWDNFDPKLTTKIMKKLSSDTATMIKTIKDSQKKHPQQQTEIARFVLYITSYSTGNYKRSQKTGIHYDETYRLYSGAAIFSWHSPRHDPADTLSLHEITDAFVPLAKRLKCNAIWVKSNKQKLIDNNPGEVVGIAWGGKAGHATTILMSQDITKLTNQ